jgi:hypothetical protein
MPTPEDYAYQAANSAAEALQSQLTAIANAVLTDEDRVSAAQWAADAYTYMLNCQAGVSIVNNNSSIESNIQTLLSTFLERYLGSSATPPTGTLEGQTYWNSVTNQLLVWDGSSWVLPPAQTSSTLNFGTSSVPNGSLQVRHDLAGLWSISNPILALGEIGVETDTNKIKIGDGTSTWNSLSYISVPSSSIVGFENVNNTSDENKPVSTLQQNAITNALNTAKEYTDTQSIGHFVDCGEYNLSEFNIYPSTNGTGTDGLILKGNVFNCTSSGTINGLNIPAGSLLRALVDNPLQEDLDWHITYKPITFDKPYIIVLYIPGMVINDFVYPQHVFTHTVTIPSGFTLSKCKSRYIASNSFTFSIRKNGIEVGTLTFAANTSNGVFASTSSITFNAGDTIEIKSQAIPDPSLYDVSFSIYGTRV